MTYMHRSTVYGASSSPKPGITDRAYQVLCNELADGRTVTYACTRAGFSSGTLYKKSQQKMAEGTQKSWRWVLKWQIYAAIGKRCPDLSPRERADIAHKVEDQLLIGFFGAKPEPLTETYLRGASWDQYEADRPRWMKQFEDTWPVVPVLHANGDVCSWNESDIAPGGYAWRD